MSGRADRLCWLCNGRLMNATHAEVETPNGPVQVHHQCVHDTREYFRKITAQPKINGWDVNNPEGDVS